MKVWHDPLLTPAGRQRDRDGSDGGQSPTVAEDPSRRRRRPETARRTGVRIVAEPGGPTDPQELERLRLLDRLLVAEGRPSITEAANRYFEAGFALPSVQGAWLQILEHNDEERVAEAIGQLASILEEEEPQRRKVLESRLRRIEDLAEMPSTQKRASDLRRMLHRRYAETLDPTPDAPVAR
jgi:hypothetical protein